MRKSLNKLRNDGLREAMIAFQNVAEKSDYYEYEKLCHLHNRAKDLGIWDRETGELNAFVTEEVYPAVYEFLRWTFEEEGYQENLISLFVEHFGTNDKKIEAKKAREAREDSKPW